MKAETDIGVIQHALQLAVDAKLVKSGFTGEAIAGDGGSPTGIVLEGDLLAIPPGTPMPSGLSPLGKEVFIALQTYGAYVVDVAGGVTTVRAQENAYDNATIQALRADMNKVLPLLQDVTVAAGGPPIGGGADVLIGGVGNDVFYVDNPGDQVIENANGGNDTVYSTVDFRLGANVENLILQGSADLQAYSNSLSNTINGNSGSNILDGGGGADVLAGGGGNDVFYVDNPGDQVIENANAGNDTVYSTAHLRIGANVENLILQGSADLQAYGNSLSNTINGNSGSNILDGGGGADALTGGAGNDAYFVDNPGDQVIENANAGNDTVFFTTHFSLGANIENLVLQGNGNLQGYGNSLSNAIYGNSGSNILDGGGGADVLAGRAGNDVYFVDNPGDAVIENANEGNDTVYSTAHLRLGANVENLILQGSANLQAYGNAQANNINGNAGNNIVDGGGGADVLTGGAGNDVFMFHAGEANGDTVVDFSGNGAAAGEVLLFFDYGAGATFTQINATQWEVNYNGGADHEVITFSNAAAIHASDYAFA